jgi:prefoldin subunit 5
LHSDLAHITSIPSDEETHEMNESQAHFVTICPNCSVRLRVKRAYLGKRVVCKGCNHSFPAIEAGGAASLGSSDGQAPVPAGDTGRVRVVCPGCHCELSVRWTLIGQMIRCKGCDSEILVPPPREHPLGSPVSGADDRRSETVLEDEAGHAHGKARSERQMLRSERDRLRAELEQLSATQNLLRNELESLQATQDRIMAENRDLSEQLAQVRREHAECSGRNEAAALEVAEAWSDERQVLCAEIEELRRQLDESEHLRREMSSALETLGLFVTPDK